MAGSQVPFPYITGLSDRAKFEIERDFLHIQQEIGAASASVYDAIVDPALAVSVPSSHLYVNFTDLIAGEATSANHTLGFNIGVVPRAFANINEPGGISFTGWSHVNIASIAPAATEGVSVGNAPFWNIPVVGMASGQIISLQGIHIPTGTGGFFGFAGSNIVLMNECWIGSGITCSPGSLYATDSFLGTQKLTGGSTSDNVILHDCVWVGAVNLGGIAQFHMLGGYLNGSLTTTGHIAGGFYLEAAIQGTVQLNHVEGGVVHNLGSKDGGFFQIGSAVTGQCAVYGSWGEVWLTGRGIRADVRLNQFDALNPMLQLVAVTDSLITADFVPTATGAQAYTIDAASARNVIIAGGTHNAFFTVASTNAGTTCLVIDELFSSSGGTTTDSVRKDMVPGELFAPQSGVNTLPATTAGVAGTAVGGSLAGTLVNPSFAGRDSSVDQINRDLLPAALMDPVGVVAGLTTFPVPVGGVTVGDADYSATPFDRHIQYGTPLTATRTVTLAFPNTVPAGTQVTISDVGAITGGFGIKIVTGAFSSINGTTTTRIINQKSGWITLESSGGVKWTIVGFSDVQEVDMNQAFLLMGG